MRLLIFGAILFLLFSTVAERQQPNFDKLADIICVEEGLE